MMTQTGSSDSNPFPVVEYAYPDWLSSAVDWDRSFVTDEQKIGVAIELSRLNVEQGAGGPFGAAIFDGESGKLVSIGVNRVVATHNSAMHAEMMAMMMAQARVGNYTLRKRGDVSYELATSSEPCAMCLGAMLWSGVSRVICGATGEDARSIGFDEGPVFPASYTYLEERGIKFVRETCRDKAKTVLNLYVEKGGLIYNA
ncbi:MAG TPA: nucleoside deaminase [Opitutales bacterium]|nr:nucleoside deaminase [Opitutales bacterium]